VSDLLRTLRARAEAEGLASRKAAPIIAAVVEIERLREALRTALHFKDDGWRVEQIVRAALLEQHCNHAPGCNVRSKIAIAEKLGVCDCGLDGAAENVSVSHTKGEV